MAGLDVSDPGFDIDAAIDASAAADPSIAGTAGIMNIIRSISLRQIVTRIEGPSKMVTVLFIFFSFQVLLTWTQRWTLTSITLPPWGVSLLMSRARQIFWPLADWVLVTVLLTQICPDHHSRKYKLSHRDSNCRRSLDCQDLGNPKGFPTFLPEVLLFIPRITREDYEENVKYRNQPIRLSKNVKTITPVHMYMNYIEQHTLVNYI